MKKIRLEVYNDNEAGIDLYFQSVNLVSYIQRIGYFEPGLSIIDVMMLNSIEKINEMLDNYELDNTKVSKYVK